MRALHSPAARMPRASTSPHHRHPETVHATMAILVTHMLAAAVSEYMIGQSLHFSRTHTNPHNQRHPCAAHLPAEHMPRVLFHSQTNRWSTARATLVMKETRRPAAQVVVFISFDLSFILKPRHQRLSITTVRWQCNLYRPSSALSIAELLVQCWICWKCSCGVLWYGLVT